MNVPVTKIQKNICRYVKLRQYNISSTDHHHDHIQNIVVPFTLLNAYSIKAREYLIHDELDTTNAEFAVVTETWLRSEDAQWAECSQFNRDGLKIITYNRQTRRGGGVALIYSDKHIVNVKESGQKKSFEYLVCTICIRGTVVALIIVYHPPYSPGNRVTNPMFIDEISQFLLGIIKSIKTLSSPVTSIFHLDDSSDPDAVLFLDIVDAMGLTPCTHPHGWTYTRSDIHHNLQPDQCTTVQSSPSAI